MVSWSSQGQADGWGIYAQRFDAGGTKLERVPRQYDHFGRSKLLRGRHGRQRQFLITWSSYNQDSPGTWGIYSQAYSADGTAKGPETRVNCTTDGDQNDSSAAFLGSDSYVVVWSGNGVGDDAGVFRLDRQYQSPGTTR